MVAFLRQGLTRSIPLWGAAGAGGLVAVICLLVPGASLDAALRASGIAELLPAPGATPRVMLALGASVAVAAIVWSALYLLFGSGGPLAAPRPRASDGVPTLRRADAHPDAPPRRPLSAAMELAAPPAPRPVEAALPADLDLPLAAFDPAAIPAVPLEPVRPVAPLAPGERLETFALRPRARPAPVAAPDSPSIEALLRRLEQGAERRVARAG